MTVPLALDRRDLLHKVAASATAGLVFIGIAFVEPLHVIGQLFIRFTDELRERSPPNARAIDRQQLPSEQIELPAQDDKLPEHLPEGRPVHTAEIGDGAEIRLQVPQQPDHLDIAMGLGFQPPARPHPVQ